MDSEEERGKRILKQIEQLEKKRRSPKFSSWIPWILAFVLVLAIVVILLTNWNSFSSLWSHLIRPDSIPGISP
ncbi:hypothetical protein CH330_00300 [candidate division WOR-3 bacterium JGI_Cruoil_03_51_56]|uniref:Uncharacterized protein n=1 Tax=candidate division WOR-3 bacterium JGI_Cruoil_03_51_56 TaxID=1973747 RepID=A0A235BYI1_UNCW3|nr:MAG: hypothetical protein CH330_00300 [candidate division WOR-3 bacterium JGI_Cruoil_03_51_56]